MSVGSVQFNISPSRSTKEIAELVMLRKNSKLNMELKDKTGKEILKYFNIDFVNSEIAKGLTNPYDGYIPDFGFRDTIEFGDKKKRSGWKMMFD